ncbi:ribosome hibernation-promoting factor, HPF/YfiA family [Candidatus Coxiella mudrowiae]|uniref:Ribosome hibernation promoting factor n=1 Tax=Candidatus Coxiella mudrowiae TaxID=2054173 RepID=A0ABM5UU47_9COXI|nr:ribosome-associated translation inhibitor RaiA [Candidatus Coxiella mudrowiae]AKQ33422.1 Ribosome-associated factor Y [Candidatus Coxiella mudrowiae]AKQ33509.1 Ribosome-associated factor Y [Candidatus Coxiella mudrowiae]
MQIQMTGHGLHISPALRGLTEKKLKRLHPCFDEITNIHITFHVNKIRQIADANLQLPGSKINAQAESEDMYKTVDLLIQKLQIQLAKYKAKKGDHR